MRRSRADGTPGQAQRLLVAALIAATAVATGLWWGGQRAARRVDAEASVAVSAQLDRRGALAVEEQLLVSQQQGGAVTRVLVGRDVVLEGVVDGQGRAVGHRSLPVADGLAVTVEVPAGDPAIRVLRYEVHGAATRGTDAVELDWVLADDRNAIALAEVQVVLRWAGGGPAEVVQVEAPGAAPTTAGGRSQLQIALGALPAHHHVGVHAALPLGAVPDGAAEDRSVMEAMGGAVPVPEPAAGGGPWWLPAAVAAAALLAFAVVRIRAGGSDAAAGTPVGPQPQPPSADSPAEVAWLLRVGEDDEADLAATLADLAARGAVRCDGGRWEVAARPPGWQPAAHEALLLDWLGGLARGGQVDAAAVAARVRTDPSGYRGLRRGFAEAVTARGRARGLVHRTVDDEGIVGAGVAAAALVTGGVAGMALGQPWWAACAVVGALVLVQVDGLARRSPEGAALAAGWRAHAAALASDPLAAARSPGHAMVLGVPVADGTAREAVALVQAASDAFVTTTSFVAGPVRPARRGR